MVDITDATAFRAISLNDVVGIFQGTDDPSSGIGKSAPTGSIFLRHVSASAGEAYIKTGPNDLDWTLIEAGTSLPIGVNLNNASTGILVGGELSVNVDPTKFDVTAGTGIIVDNHTDPLNPTAILVTWGTQVGITVTNLATAPRSFIAVDNTGTVIQTATPWTDTEHKNHIVLGNLGHANYTSIVAYRNNPDPAFDPAARLADLGRALGSFNISGNVFYPHGIDLQLAKNAGYTYRVGTNFHVNKKDTDTTDDLAEDPVTFRYSYRNGSGGFVLVGATTIIDPSMWDDGSGILQTVPGGKWTVQQVVYFGGIIGPSTRVEYGQHLFPTKQAALDLLPDPDFIPNPAFVDGVIRLYLVLQSGATNLSDPTQAEFIEAAKFGSSGGGQFSGSITDLQQAYNNSTYPEITTDVSRGPIDLKEGVGVGGNLLVGHDDTDTIVFELAVDGTLPSTKLDYLSDVIITTPSNGEVLTYQAGNWVNASVAAGTDKFVGITVTDTTPGYLNDKLVAGTGISFTVNTPGGNESITITNTSPNVDQNVWVTISSDSGSTIANTTTDTLTISGGTGISTSVVGDILTITNTAPNVTQNVFTNIAVSGQNTVIADSSTDTLTLVAGTNISITTDDTTDSITINATTGGSQNVFETVSVTDTDSGYTWINTGSVVADSTTDTLTVVSGVGINIDVDPTNDAIRITNTSPNVNQNLWETILSDSGSTIANTTTDTLTISGGTGISTAIVGDVLTIINTSPNVDQNTFQNVAVSGQNTIVADSTTDTLTLAAGTGIAITTNDATDTITIAATGGAGTQNLFETITVPSGGPVVADSPTDILTLTQSSGISITGNATTDTINIAPANDLAALEGLATTGFATRIAADTWATRTITGTTDQIDVTNGAGIATNPIIALANNVVLPGNEAVQIIAGTTAQRPLTPTIGDMRFNTDTVRYEAWNGTTWVTFGANPGSAVSEIKYGQLSQLTGTTIIPYTNSPPLITDGTEFFTNSMITTTSSAKVVIWFSTTCTVSNSNRIITVSLWRNTTLIGVFAIGAPSSNSPVIATGIIADEPGVAGTYTYSARIGVSASASWYVGGWTPNANYGGATNTNNQYVLMRLE